MQDKPKRKISEKALANLRPGQGRPKGIKNKATLFKEAWKAGLEKVVAERGGPEKFVREWLESRQGKQELNGHMLKVIEPITEKKDVNVSGGIEVITVDNFGSGKKES